MVVLASHHFRGRVTGTAASRLQGLTGLIGVGEAEVDDFDIVVVVHEEVLGFQVPVANTELVHILDP